MSDSFLLFHDAPTSHFHRETAEHLRLKSAKRELLQHNVLYVVVSHGSAQIQNHTIYDSAGE